MKYWTTFPDIHLAAEGYGSEHFAPGYQEPIFGGHSDYPVLHYFLKSHAIAYQLYNNEFKEKQKGKQLLYYNNVYVTNNVNISHLLSLSAMNIIK